jgi:ketoreductase RED2
MGQVDVVSLIGPGPLDGRVALVTGSSCGVGVGIAGRIAERGATVVVDSTARVSEVVAAKRRATTYAPADVGDPDDAERLVATAVERHGHLDILVNATAAVSTTAPGDADAATTGDWEPVLRATVVGPWNVIRAATPHLRAAGGGVIINVSSTAASPPAGSSIPHALCEAGLSHLTALLANALRPDIRVYAAAAAEPDTGRLVADVPAWCPEDRPDAAMTPLSRSAARDIEAWLADAPLSARPHGMGPCRGPRRARQSHRRHRNDPRFGWESLTTAELRVAEAVASGLSNAQAAQRLFVSPFTVDYHLRQIFLKLGIRSRVQLAAFVTRN